MRSLKPRAALLDCAETGGDVAAGALWLAAEDCPGVEPEAWLARLDELAAEVRTRCGANGCSPTDHPLVAALLRDRLRLRGAGGGDPRAHYLHQVIERGTGVPIACSVVWIAVGRRADIPVDGVNLPGHFIVRVEGDLIDPMAGGGPLDDDDVRRLVATSTGSEPDVIDPCWLAPATTRDILARMSRNLRRCYASLEDWENALRSADRCVALLPDNPSERRDRGLLLWRMGQSSAALDDLSFYLDRAPNRASDRTAITEIAGRLRAFLN